MALGKKNLLGKAVIYTDGNGYQKAALVIGTPDSVQDGTEIERPGDGSVLLKVFSPSGQDYIRNNVTEGEGPRTYATR